MNRRLFVIAWIVAFAIGTFATETQISDALVAEAMQAGDISKHYRLLTASKRNVFILGYFSTPFFRIALAAAHAKRQYSPFTAADVTHEMRAPELWVYVFADNSIGIRRGPDIREVKAVVLTPRGARDAAGAIHPIRTMPFSEEQRELFGATFDGKGLIAVFPIAHLSEANEIHVIYEDYWSCGISGAQDCRVPIKLENVR